MPDECDVCPFAGCAQCPRGLTEAGTRLAGEAEIYANTEVADEDMPMDCPHDWMLRPESDTYECLMCGAER